MQSTTNAPRNTGQEADIIHFPEGLPAFETEREFLLRTPAEAAPLVLLESIRTPELVFVTVPVTLLAPDYVLQVEPESLALVGWTLPEAPKIGAELICLAVLTLGEQPTANLLSPVIIHPATRLACQVIQTDSPYSCRHPLSAPSPAKEVACS